MGILKSGLQNMIENPIILADTADDEKKKSKTEDTPKKSKNGTSTETNHTKPHDKKNPEHHFCKDDD